MPGGWQHKDESLRVLIVTQYFWPESFRINDLAIGLKNRGHEVTVLTGLPNYPQGKLYPGYEYSTSKEHYQGLDVIRVPMVTRGSSKGLRLILNYLSYALSACVLGPRLCRGPIDAIFVFQPSPFTVALPALVMKRVLRAPILFWVQDLWPESLKAADAVRSGWLLGLVDRLVRYVYRRCERVLVQSRGFVSYIQTQGVEPERIRYFPNSAETFFTPLSPEKCREEDRELPAGFRILYTGNIGVAQAFDTVLDAAERTRHVSEVQWVVIGDGRDGARVCKAIAERGLGATVHMMGSRPVETIPRYLAVADVLMVSLKRDPAFAETIPSKVQSYLACGKPILAALEGEGARVIQDSRSGAVCPPEDAEKLAAEALKLYAMSPFERLGLGVNGRKYFEAHFDSAHLLDQLETWITEVTQGTEQMRCAA